MVDTASPSWEVINTKVEFQGKQLEQLSEDTAKQFVDFRTDTNTQLQTLRNDVKGEFNGLKVSLESLATKLDTNNNERANGSRGIWISLLGTGVGAIAVACTIIGTIATLRLTPIENDIKNGKDNQTAIITTLDRISTKLDNFETRPELTEHNKVVDTAIASKADAIALDFAIKERITDTNRLAADIMELKANQTQNRATILALQLQVSIDTTVLTERRRELDRVTAQLDKAPTPETIEGLKDRIQDLRERAMTISTRVQGLYDKNYATPKFPCLDSGAGCGPVGPTGPQVQPSQSNGR